MNKSLINVPNLLTVSRVVFLPLLFVFVILDMRLAFTIAFIFLGSTDFFDGLFARLLNQVTPIGKMLDSVADLIFYISTAWFVYRLYPAYLEPNYWMLILFFVMLFISFIISFIRCGKPILMHTFILRMNAVLIYFMVIMSYFMDTTWFISIIFISFYIGFIEEIAIFIKYGQVDADTPTIFTLLAQEKEAQTEQ